jgi:hypothetical protein
MKKSKLPPNPLPGVYTSRSTDREPDVEPQPKERRVPSRMSPGEIPLAKVRLLMPWHLMWPE